VRFRFIEAEKATFPVRMLCRVLAVSRSGFYAWTGRGPSERAKADVRLAVEIAASHRQSRCTYGSPRVHRDLRARGWRLGEKRVARLMREHGIVPRQKRRFRRTTHSNHGHAVAANVLDRRFVVKKRDWAWVTDVTYLETLEGWAYLAVILDLFSRRVVGWAISATNDTTLALEALGQALRGRRPPRGLIHHSDRGSPYASDEYRQLLAGHGLVGSMSRRGDCWDNAVAESFFATLRAELVDHERYETRAQAIGSVGDYIDRFYNPRRRHSYLGYVSPLEYELRAELADRDTFIDSVPDSSEVLSKAASPNGSRALRATGAATSVSPENGLSAPSDAWSSSSDMDRSTESKTKLKPHSRHNHGVHGIG